MSVYHPDSVVRRRSCVWAFSLLALLGLAACGTSDQGASAATPAGTAQTTTGAPEQQPAGAAETPGSPEQQPTAVPRDLPTESSQLSGEPTAPTPTPQPAPSATPAKPSPAPLPPEPLNPTAKPAPVPPTAPPAAPTTAPAPASVWPTYRNDQAGYSVAYPPDWTISEQVGADGSSTATFMPSKGGAKIVVLVQMGEQLGQPNDIPNTRCQQVTIGGLTGTRCFDTIAFSTSTTLIGRGKTYTIVTAGKQTDQAVYQRLVDSFAVTS